MTAQIIKDQIPMRNISFGGQMPALSEGKPAMDEQKDLLGEDVTFNIDDVLIDRSAGGRFNNSSFFGLAVMCGSIGMASFMSASSPTQVTETRKINSGSNMAGTKYMSEVDSVPMKNQSEDIVDNYVEQTPYQNMLFAF